MILLVKNNNKRPVGGGLKGSREGGRRITKTTTLATLISDNGDDGFVSPFIVFQKLFIVEIVDGIFGLGDWAIGQEAIGAT